MCMYCSMQGLGRYDLVLVQGQIQFNPVNPNSNDLVHVSRSNTIIRLMNLITSNLGQVQGRI